MKYFVPIFQNPSFVGMLATLILGASCWFYLVFRNVYPRVHFLPVDLVSPSCDLKRSSYPRSRCTWACEKLSGFFPSSCQWRLFYLCTQRQVSRPYFRPRLVIMPLSRRKCYNVIQISVLKTFSKITLHRNCDSSNVEPSYALFGEGVSEPWTWS